MPQGAYFITSSRAVRVANDNGSIPLNLQHLPAMMQTGVRHSRLSETVLFVEEGIVEFMIGGASGLVSAGGFVRIPAGTSYSFRNPGDETATVVSRTRDRSEAFESAAEFLANQAAISAPR